MTFPYKEELIFIEKIASKQHNIFKDSVDVGVHIYEIDEYNKFKEAFKNLKEFYGYNVTFVNDKQRTVEIAIPVEFDERRYNCIIIEANYFKQTKKHPELIRKNDKDNSFITINFRNEKLTKNHLINEYKSEIFG